MKRLFDLGTTVATKSVHEEIEHETIGRFILRHCSGDFGDLCEEDREANLAAIKNGGRILSKYNTDSREDVYVITEWDRSATTVLYTSEY